MKSLYVRVADASHDYVVDQSASSGLSMAVVVSMILNEARILGWEVTSTDARIVKTSGSPAADSHEPAKGSVPRDQGRAVDVPPQSAPGPLGSKP